MPGEWDSFPLADPDPDPETVPSRPSQGYATIFADPRDQVRYAAAKAAGKTEQQALSIGDPGIGASRLGAINTANAYGVAVPTSYLRENFGNDPSAWRTARAQLGIGGRTVQVPFVDVGPGTKQQAKGVITDVTYQLSQALGGFDMAKATLAHLPNAGPDYMTNQDAWFQEQANIGKLLGAQPIGATPSPTPASAQFANPAAPSDWNSFPIVEALLSHG